MLRQALLVALAASAPVKLIIDTDAGFDVDDVGALCIANALQDQGEAEILAVAHTNGFAPGIGAVAAVMQYYNRTGAALGAYKGAWASGPGPYPGHEHHGADRYASHLARGWPTLGGVRHATQVPSPADVYRRVLAAQPDGSVVIASIGVTTNMRDLVASPPDAASSLAGAQLIARKVARIVWMDGQYNFGCAQHDTRAWLGPDVPGCRGSARAAVRGWPASVPQVFTSVGGDVLHGGELKRCAALANPCRQAFADWGVAGIGRMSWDPIAVLLAVRGPAAARCVEQGGGYNTVSEAGDEAWVGKLGPVLKPHNTTFNQTRVRFGDFRGEDPRPALGRELDRLLCRLPGARLGGAARPELARWARLPGADCSVGGGGSASAAAAAIAATVAATAAAVSAGGAGAVGRRGQARVRSVEACQRRCLLQPRCEAITVFGPGKDKLYSCHLAPAVQLAGCRRAGTWRTQPAAGALTLVRRPWAPLLGFDCRNADMEHPAGSSCGVVDAPGCQRLCDATVGCTAVTWAPNATGSGYGYCRRRAGVDFAHCEPGAGVDTYISGRNGR